MKNILRKTALFAAGVYSLSKEKVQDFVDSIQEEGEISEDEGRQLVEDLWARAKGAEERMQEAVEEKVKSALEKAKFASREEVEELRDRVEKLEK